MQEFIKTEQAKVDKPKESINYKKQSAINKGAYKTNLNDMKKIANDSSQVEQVFEVLTQCVHEIHFGEQIFHRIDISEKDINEFIDQLTGEQFEKIINFFNTMPKLRHVIPVTNPNTNIQSEVVLEGLSSFLGQHYLTIVYLTTIKQILH